jgi:hypothetical protein
VLVGAGTSNASLLFMAFAFVGAVGVLIWRRWSWLAVAAYVVSAPQAASWIERARSPARARARDHGIFWPCTSSRLSAASCVIRPRSCASNPRRSRS